MIYSFFVFVGLFSTFSSFCFSETIPITIEIAKTDNQRAWGLMKKDSMPANHGMLFYNPTGYVWMFNTNIDLSLAFLDKSGTIISIHELQAFPQMMDPQRPVNSVADFWKYPTHDKIYQFFLHRSQPVPLKAKFVLEMNWKWFDRHGVQAGDRLIWHRNSPNATIKTIN